MDTRRAHKHTDTSLNETPQVDRPRSASGHPHASEPTSKLLRDLLQERRAESRRVGQGTDAESHSSRSISNAFDPREVQSSPLGKSAGRSEKSRQENKANGGITRAVSNPKEMGMREMEEVFIL